MIGSVVALLALAGAAFLVVSLLARVQGHAFRWWIAAVMWGAAIAGILFVDVNVPLSESHLYPDSAPAPLWLALLAAFARFAAFASLCLVRPLLHAGPAEPQHKPAAGAPNEL